MSVKCECPYDTSSGTILPDNWYLPEEEKAAKHLPNECPGDFYLLPYTRNGKELSLCSRCFMPDDVCLDKVKCLEMKVNVGLKVLEGLFA